jgi:hypothetical protein
MLAEANEVGCGQVLHRWLPIDLDVEDTYTFSRRWSISPLSTRILTAVGRSGALSSLSLVWMSMQFTIFRSNAIVDKGVLETYLAHLTEKPRSQSGTDTSAADASECRGHREGRKRLMTKRGYCSTLPCSIAVPAGQWCCSSTSR